MAIALPPCGTPRRAWPKISAEILTDIDKNTVPLPITSMARCKNQPFSCEVAQLATDGFGRYRGRHGNQNPPHNLGEVCDAIIACIKQGLAEPVMGTEDATQPARPALTIVPKDIKENTN